MNPTSKSPLPVALDPVVAAVLEQLKEKVEAKDRIIAEKDQALSAAEAIIQQLKEALRAERVARYGQRSEKLSDLQLQLLDLEPGVSSDEIEGEVASGPLPDHGTRPALVGRDATRFRRGATPFDVRASSRSATNVSKTLAKPVVRIQLQM